MIKRFIYNSNRALGTLMITLYAVGILPFSFSNSCSNELYQPGNIKMETGLASLKSADAWINTIPLTEKQLKGKVVLIQFCTYTCINWLRTMPNVRAWKEKYKDGGLEVIFVHTPEFSFEKNIENVRHSMTEMKIDIPVAIDNNYTIWKAFNNQYWPALYFIDIKGRIRHTKFGEGDYDESEKVIQLLLKEAGNKNVGQDLVTVNAQGIEIAADWSNLNSQENYLGYERTQNFSSQASKYDKQHSYTAPDNLGLNDWALSGKWTIKSNSIRLNRPGGKIVYHFHARDMHIVMGTIIPGTAIRFRVLIDGTQPGSAHGIDIDDQGYGTIIEPRLYQLIRQTRAVEDREVTIEFLDPGVEAFSFTFG